MGAMQYAGDLARIQRELAQSHDLVIRRTTTLEALNLNVGEHALELGCGGGFYAAEAARWVGPAGKIVAIDVSDEQVAAARQQCAAYPWVECHVADATALPFADAAFDAVFANQVIEYVPDFDRALTEAQRVLKPGGRIIIVATNWSSLVWYSTQPERMARMLAAWATHTPFPDLPALLPARLRRAGLQPIRQVPVPILNNTYHPHSFSYWGARLIHAFVMNRRMVPVAEADAWLAEFEELQQEGAYFLSSTPVLTEAIKMA